MRHLLPATALWRGSDVDGIGYFAVDLDLDECRTLEAAAIELAATGVDPTDAGLGRWGAHIGSVGDQPDLFQADMLAFHASVFSP